jgi:ATP-dependent helicase/nuclease subunit B
LETFLQKTANYLAAKYPDHISDICIVLPNRRAGLFFKRHLAQTSGKAMWSPDIFSAEDFIANLSGLEIIDQLNQLFELYSIYRKSKGKEAETFDEFSKWAATLLADFNEVDRYMANGSKLFSNLGDIREIENWSLGEENLTDFQTTYIKFWDSLGWYYKQITRALLDKKKAYPGLAYRYCADNISELVKRQRWHRIIFAGFNALTTAEERIIRTLVEMEKAEVLWDADSYYVKNKNHEAGRFLRKYKTQLHEVAGGAVDDEEPGFLWEENNLSSSPKQIEVIGVARNVAQAKVTGDIVASLRIPEPEMENTAIVLADENLLFPVLHSLPENVKDVNVTMGFPLRNTPVAGLFELLFNLHENPMRFGKNTDRFYHRDLIKFLSHPYINHLFRNAEPVNRYLVFEIQKRNAVFISMDRLERELVEEHHRKEFEVLKPLFNKWRNVNDALKCCYALIEALKNALVRRDKKGERNDKAPNLELEFVYTYAKILRRVRTLVDDYGHITQIKTLHSIVTQTVYSTSLPFYGEPLRGLQVMGMLETRALDFETVILLSANENMLPSGRSQNSFIPYDLRRVFGLPTHTDRDAVFAYHFYRLLQRARTVYLLYNTETDKMGSGEKSRFITQLLHELPQANKDAVIRERLLDISAQSAPGPEIIIEKTPDILEQVLPASILFSAGGRPARAGGGRRDDQGRYARNSDPQRDRGIVQALRG